MKNNIKLSLPKFIIEAFPVLKDAEYIRSFATLFILYPDTQSYELKEITGRYEFEFTRIVAPYRNDKFIEIRQHDDTEAGYDIRDPHGRCCYYLAEATYKPDWVE